MSGIEMIKAERVRLIEVNALTNQFCQANLQQEELIEAAKCYLKGRKCVFIGHVKNNTPVSWPEGLPKSFWQLPPDRISELVKAGALIAAEIDRLLAINDCEASHA